MAKCKYDPNTFPVLAEGLARDGLIEKQIAEKLGISESTLNVYKNKFPEFSEAIKRGKGPVDTRVENALLKRAEGYDYNEEHTEVKTESYNENGKKVTKTVKVKKIVNKHIVPDVAAAIFWLKNRRPDKWRDKISDSPSEENIDEIMKEYAALIREGDEK